MNNYMLHPSANNCHTPSLPCRVAAKTVILITSLASLARCFRLQQSMNVVVVGAGIIGASISRQLAARGARVSGWCCAATHWARLALQLLHPGVYLLLRLELIARSCTIVTLLCR